MKRRSLLKTFTAFGVGSSLRGLFFTANAQSRDRRWPDPAANHVVPYLTSGLTHGPVLGAPTANSMRVWVRTKEPVAFKVVYDTKLPLSAGSPGVEGRANAARDNTGVVELTGLRADTRYYYGVVINNQLADTRMELKDEFPSFWTLPDESSRRDAKYNPAGRFNFSFSVGCCADQHAERERGGQYGSPPVFDTMFERHGHDLSFHLMNGDFIYEELRDGTMNGVRANYKLYYERGRSMSKFFRHVPALFTYDDHEITSDDGSGEVGLKKGRWTNRDFNLAPWYEYAGWANYHSPYRQPLRFGKATVKRGDNVLHDGAADFSTLQPEAVSTLLVLNENKNAGVYRCVEVLDGNRLRVEPAFGEDEECSYSIGTHHYYDWKVGNCHFFALDCRGESNRYLIERAHDPQRFILGEAQVKWLMEKIRETDAQFIFIVSGVSWVIYHTDFHVRTAPLKPGEKSRKEDGFNGAVVEREKLLKFFDGLDKQVMIFTGDLHNSYAVQITDNVWEFMVGPMNSAAHPRSTAGFPPAGGWFDAEGRKVKIKWMLSYPDELHYTRLHPTVYGVVNVNNVLKSARQDGPGLHWVAYDAPQVVMQFYDGYTGELLYAEGISRADLQRA